MHDVLSTAWPVTRDELKGAIRADITFWLAGIEARAQWDDIESLDGLAEIFTELVWPVVQAAKAGFHALRSYQHGNGARDLAKLTADSIQEVLGALAEKGRR